MPAGLAGTGAGCGRHRLAAHAGQLGPGSDDGAVIALAAREGRILVTTDRGLPAQVGSAVPPAILVCDEDSLSGLPDFIAGMPAFEFAALLIVRQNALRIASLWPLVRRHQETTVRDGG